MSDKHELEAALEALLFATGDPVSKERLLEVFDEADRELAAEALDAVVERYRPSPERGLLIEEVAGGYRMATRPELGDYLRRFFAAGGRSRLTMAALETLAIIAYRQPITAPEIQELRGVSPAGVLRTLLERRLIRISGRKEVVGRPFLYATTREFLVHFGLNSIRDLPPLEEFEELLEGGAEGLSMGSGPSDGRAAGLEAGDTAEELDAQAAEELDAQAAEELEAQAVEELDSQSAGELEEA
ncbi:MAG: SMC-Scp complex subunit ScpB [Thermoanaerobaculia bacterium]